MEAFMKWIENEINPMRQRNGLCVIGRAEQVRCYEILQAFHAKMKKTPNTDFNRTTAEIGTCTRPDITDCHAKVGTGGRCMNGTTCQPLQGRLR